MKRRRSAWLVAGSAALMVAVVLYRGPGHQWARGHLGDALAVAFLFGALGLATAWSTARKATLVAAVAVAVELGQLNEGAGERSSMVQLLVGGHFDPWDFLYYGVGLCFGAAVDCWSTARWKMSRAVNHVCPVRLQSERVLSRWRSAGSDAAGSRGPFARLLYELLVFGVKQAWACLFGALLLALIVTTHFVYPDGLTLTRYDFLVLAAVTVQILLLACGLETWQEAKVILVYHLVGTVMEIFKTHVGSWSYPEPNVLRVGGVPLFSGFMYAAVGSYLARVWRLFDFRFEAYPRRRWTLVLAIAIYVNFFTHHFGWDARWLLFGGAFLVFGRSWVHFRIDQEHRRMPLIVGFALVAFFIWLAENVATFGRAWTYPHQGQAWQPVSISKFGSWFLLMIISFVLVTLIRRPEPLRRTSTPACA